VITYVNPQRKEKVKQKEEDSYEVKQIRNSMPTQPPDFGG
jgi:hypothetical protein